MVTVERLKSRNQTANKMYNLVDEMAEGIENVYVKSRGRLVSLKDLTFNDFFTWVKNIPYRIDNKPIEVIGSPERIFEIISSGRGIDCKKKAILIASWIRSNLGSEHYRFIASSNRRDRKITHVYPEMLVGKTWRPVDATYRRNKPFVKNGLTKREIL